MPRYILQFKTGGKEFKSKIIEAETHNHAMIMFRRRHSRKLKGMSTFDILDKIGVVKDLTECKERI